MTNWRAAAVQLLLSYLDPSVDISNGDLIGVKPMSETYLGVGASHRSGIFGGSRLLGNVNGGTNYIYSYLEWRTQVFRQGRHVFTCGAG